LLCLRFCNSRLEQRELRLRIAQIRRELRLNLARSGTEDSTPARRCATSPTQRLLNAPRIEPQCSGADQCDNAIAAQTKRAAPRRDAFGATYCSRVR
jgi:hypothetical protein